MTSVFVISERKKMPASTPASRVHRSSVVKALAFDRGAPRFDPSGGILLLPSPIVGPYSAGGGNVWWANVGRLW